MLISDLKLLLRFNTAFLYEDVSTSTMDVVGDIPYPLILPSGGYVMANNQYLKGEGPSRSGYQTDVNDAFTIGFWLYPVNPGVAIDDSSGDAVPITMPLIYLNTFGSTEYIIINITEQTTADGENNIKVSLNNDVYSASSEDYAPFIWHYFWIVYDGASELSIYIDGKKHVLQGATGVFPSHIDGGRLDVYVNHSLDGYAFNVAKNYGYISDLFMMNVSNNSESSIQRVINNGINYLVDDNYTDTFRHKSNIYFNDPETITVTSSIDDMSYVYVGRNDGKILRGSPLLWETRRTFASDGEIELTGLSYDVNGDPDGWRMTSAGFLELTSKNIRL